MGDDDEMAVFVVTEARDAVAGEPAREDVWCVRGASRALIAEDLAVGAGHVGGLAVTHGFGVDVWDVGDRLLARVAEGWRANDTDEGSRRERFFVSEDRGVAWTEVGSADARDLEHRRTEERLVARLDRWPASWC
ncbi:hypothetical protein [Sandaracinus amylolyticus]|uniref:Uncharacterized protein n=1 Tax=Sandaracinus amylolyticus TaxID=927083 RepID=A0A0F6W503_9BACT|nr:hypothetical protein [Sandaracinus amylolyticus]AKF07580.1 hypothetical protein DB32_004729 [Sandaracinus amylolyticus]